MSAVKPRKPVRPQARSKSYRPFQSGSSYHSHTNKEPKGPEYLNHDNANEQLTAAFLFLVGCPIEVQTSEGATYEGILETISPEYELSVRSVHVKSERRQKRQDGSRLPNKENIRDTVKFPFVDIVCINCANVDIDYARRDGLMTDSSISGNGIIMGRPLKKWEGAEEASHSSGISLSLEDGGGMQNGWDYEEMLRVNKEKYGVKTSFDSSMSTYMSEIEGKDSEEYRERELKAQKLVLEIENDASFKEHDDIDSGVTEEDKFSAVLKTDVAGSLPRSHGQVRGKKNIPPRSHSSPDGHNKQMVNSHSKRTDDKPLYSQLVKKSISQPKSQDLNPRIGSSPSPRTSSPTYHAATQPIEDLKVKQANQPVPLHGVSKKVPSAPQVSQPMQPQSQQPLAVCPDTTELTARNGLEKPNEQTRFKTPIAAPETNGKGGLPKRRELKETVKYGKIIKPEPQETVDIESLKKFREGFKLNESSEKNRGKDNEVSTPSQSSPEETQQPQSREAEEQPIEAESASNVSSEAQPQSANENATPSGRDGPVTEPESQELTVAAPKESVEEPKIDVTKSTLNPLAAEFDPRKIRPAPRSSQVQPTMPPAMQNVYSSAPSAMHLAHVPSNIITANPGNPAMVPRPAMMATSKRAGQNRYIVSTVQEQASTVPGNHVQTYLPNSPVVFFPQNSHYSHQGQVISMNVPQHVRYVINNGMNQHPVVQQPMSMASGYQDTSPAVFLGSQPSQVIPHTVMTAAQPGYGPAPPQQQGVQPYGLASTGHFSHYTTSMSLSQQAGTPGPAQIHPHAVHPSAQQQQRGPFVVPLYPISQSINMQPSQMVPGQPHSGGMQSFQHSS